MISKYAALKREYYGIVLTVYPAESWAPRVGAHESTHIANLICMTQQQQKTSALGKPERRSIYSADRQTRDRHDLPPAKVTVPADESWEISMIRSAV